jgi:hypothetical protein
MLLLTNATGPLRFRCKASLSRSGFFTILRSGMRRWWLRHPSMGQGLQTKVRHCQRVSDGFAAATDLWPSDLSAARPSHSARPRCDSAGLSVSAYGALGCWPTPTRCDRMSRTTRHEGQRLGGTASLQGSGNATAGLKLLGDLSQHAHHGLAGDRRRLALAGVDEDGTGHAAAGRIGHGYAQQHRCLGQAVHLE